MADYSKILITGATSGIGYALAHLFIQRNKKIIAVGRKESALQELRSWGCQSEKLDLSTPTEIEQLRRLIEQDQPDLIIHCAGYTQYNFFGNRTWDELLAEHHIHTQATLAIAHSLHQLAKAHPQGSYCAMFLSSAVAYTPVPGMTVYSTGKQWMMTLCRMLNIENPSNLKFLCSAPGPVTSAFHSRASEGRLDERIAGVVSAEKAASILMKQIQKQIEERPLGPMAWLAKISSHFLPQRLIAKYLFKKVKERFSPSSL